MVVNEKPWSIAMTWRDLLFMHWPVDIASLRPHIPAALDIDTFGGTAWIGVVPFAMTGIRHRLCPPIPGTSAFLELNVRTYVTHGGKPGVWFFSLDAANRLAVRVARKTFHLPYMDARMQLARDGEAIAYRSTRTHRGEPAATFDATYRPTGDVYQSRAGDIDYFLTERYCLYAADRRGKVYRGDIDHVPWPLQPATCAVRANTMIEADGEPLLHFARKLHVKAWALRAVR